MKKVIIRLMGTYLNLLALLAPAKAGKKAFDLFCKPQRAPLKHYQLAFLDTSNKFDIDFEGLKIQGYKWGKGPKKLLFLHGWQSHSFRWKKMVETLSLEEYTLIAIDAPAHGLSEGKSITAVLYHKLIVKTVEQLGPMHGVVSHSLGGFSLMFSLYKNPHLPIGKAVLMGAPGEVSDFLLSLQQVLRLSTKCMEAVYTHFEKEIGLHPSYFSAIRFAEKLQVPALLIHDKEDREAPYHYAEAVSKVWNNAQLISTTGMGHNLRNQEVVHWVGEFMKDNQTAFNNLTYTEQAKA